MYSKVITPPSTYAEWIDILDILKEKSDDAAVLPAMKKGTIEWQTGVAERFTRKLVDVINYRMNAASDRFQKEMSYSKGQESVIVQALIALRKEMYFLSEAINLPVIPEKDRQKYYQLVISQADSMQNELEKSAKKDYSGKIASIVRNNRVNAFQKEN